MLHHRNKCNPFTSCVMRNYRDVIFNGTRTHRQPIFIPKILHLEGPTYMYPMSLKMLIYVTPWLKQIPKKLFLTHMILPIAIFIRNLVMTRKCINPNFVIVLSS